MSTFSHRLLQWEWPVCCEVLVKLYAATGISQTEFTIMRGNARLSTLKLLTAGGQGHSH